MVKKIVSLLITVLIVCSSVNFAVAGTENLVATDLDITILEDDINDKYYWFKNTGYNFEDIDINNLVSNIMLGYGIGQSNEKIKYTITNEVDPLNLLYNQMPEYLKIPEQIIDSKITNEFNRTPNHNYFERDGYWDEGEYIEGWYLGYYYEGYYYYQIEGIGGVFPMHKIVEYNRLADGKYLITAVGISPIDDYDVPTLYYLVELKFINGKKLWTFYNISESLDEIKNSKAYVGFEKLISIKLNNNPLIFDILPYSKDGLTMVQATEIADAMGCMLTWNQSTYTATITNKSSNELKFTLGSSTAYNTGTPITLQSAPEIINGKLMIPVGDFARNMGATVNWNNDTKTVYIDYDTKNAHSDEELKYIKAHNSFIKSEEYNYVKNLDLAQDIAISLSENKKMDTAIRLNDALSFNWLKEDFNNYYDIILADMLLSESLYNNIEDNFETKYNDNMNSFVANVSDILEEKYTDDFTVSDKNFIEKLFISNDEIKDTKTYEKINKMLSDTFNENEILEMLDYGNKIAVTLDFANKGGKVVEAIKNTSQYYSVVNAYIDTNEEFKTALKLISSNLTMQEINGNSNEQYKMFNEALKRYIELNDKNGNQIALNIAGKAVSEGLKAGVEIFGKEYVNCVVTFVKSIKLSNGLTIAEAASKATKGNKFFATAGEVFSGLGAAKIGYDIGMLFNNTFLPNNDISINVKYIETDGNMAIIAKNAMLACESNLYLDPSYDNAQKFDGVFSFYKAIQMDTCKRMVALDESEKRNLTNIFSSKNQKSLNESINNSKAVNSKLSKINCH